MGNKGLNLPNPLNRQQSDVTTSEPYPNSNSSNVTSNSSVVAPLSKEDQEIQELIQDSPELPREGVLRINEREKLETLIKSLSESVASAEAELQSVFSDHTNIPGVTQLKEKVHTLGSELQTELLSYLTEKERPLRAVLVAPSGWGKTTLLRALCGKNATAVPETLSHYWVPVSPTLEVLDIFGMKPDGQGYDTDMKNNLIAEIKDKTPDVAIVVCSATEPRNWAHRKADIIEVLEIIKAHKISKLPLFWVVTRLDLADKSDLPWARDDEESWSGWKKRIEGNMDAVRKEVGAMCKQKFGDLFNENFFHVTSVSTTGNLGVTGTGGLLDAINLNTPLYAQIHIPGINRYIQLRRSLAIKIIGLFSSVNFVVGALPGVDVVLTPIVDWCMLKILQHLRTHPERTAEEYRAQHMIRLVTGLVTRTAFLVLSFVAELTLVLSVVGSVAGAIVSAASTTSLGYHAYNYFTEGSEEQDY